MRAVLLEVPHRQQRYPADCLAACAAMILGYIGILISYQRLLKLLRAKEFGTPLLTFVYSISLASSLSISKVRWKNSTVISQAIVLVLHL